MPLEGFTCEELKQALGLEHASSATKAWTPAVEKVARAMLYSPAKTIAALSAEMAKVLAEMDRREFDSRARINTGRMDRSTLHPQAMDREKAELTEIVEAVMAARAKR